MAFGNTVEDNTSLEEVGEQGTNAPDKNSDTGEEQHTQAPPGICDICAEFYQFLVSGKP